MWRRLLIVVLSLSIFDGVAAYEGARPAERAIASAFVWLARHQNNDGSWHIDYTAKCKDASCSHGGSLKNDTAATALAILQLLGAGAATPAYKSRYTPVANRGLAWLASDMRAAADPATGKARTMSAHGLASVCFCEWYAAAPNEENGAAARAALKLIADRQNSDGGWGEKPGDASDMIVVAWQMMALRSAQLAKIAVAPAVTERARKFVQACSHGKYDGLFSDAPAKKVSPTATAIGVLTLLYLGAQSDDLGVAEGKAYLLQHLASAEHPDPLYWFFATQAMHYQRDPDWLAWNRQVRNVIVKMQATAKDQCAAGSWICEAPDGPPLVADGGRLVTTSLCTLTLEVYYCYLQIFRPTE